MRKKDYTYRKGPVGWWESKDLKSFPGAVSTPSSEPTERLRMIQLNHSSCPQLSLVAVNTCTHVVSSGWEGAGVLGLDNPASKSLFVLYQSRMPGTPLPRLSVLHCKLGLAETKITHINDGAHTRCQDDYDYIHNMCRVPQVGWVKEMPGTYIQEILRPPHMKATQAATRCALKEKP